MLVETRDAEIDRFEDVALVSCGDTPSKPTIFAWMSVLQDIALIRGDCERLS